MEQKTKFRDQLKEFVRKDLKVEIGNLPTIRQSKAMTRFYVEEIRKIFSPGLIPDDPDDLDTCVIDGSDDCGIDFLARADGTVLIIQSKFRGSGVHESLEEFASFGEVLRRIHPEVGRKYKKNQKLVEAISDIDWDNDFFELVYITMGRCGPNLRVREKEGPSLGNGLDFLEDRSQLTLNDETDLNGELREALSAGETISGQIPISFVPTEGDSPWLKFEGEHKRSVYLGFVSGSEIAQIYKPHNHRFRLFALNIRDWIGETGTNKGILSTAENRPGDFLFLIMESRPLPPALTRIWKTEYCVVRISRSLMVLKPYGRFTKLRLGSRKRLRMRPSWFAFQRFRSEKNPRFSKKPRGITTPKIKYPFLISEAMTPSRETWPTVLAR
jgi:hypothetical protein